MLILLTLSCYLNFGGSAMGQIDNFTSEKLSQILNNNQYYDLKEYEKDQMIDYQLGLESLFIIPLDFVETAQVNLIDNRENVGVRSFPELLLYYQNQKKENNNDLSRLSAMVDSILKAIGDNDKASYECNDFRFSTGVRLSHREPIDPIFRKKQRTLIFSNKLCRITDYLFNKSNATNYEKSLNKYFTDVDKLNNKLLDLEKDFLFEKNDSEQKILDMYEKLYLEIVFSGYLRRSFYAYPPMSLLEKFFHSKNMKSLDTNWHLNFLIFVKNNL